MPHECTNDIRMLYTLNDIESYSLYHIDHTISYGPYESYDMLYKENENLVSSSYHKLIYSC